MTHWEYTQVIVKASHTGNYGVTAAYINDTPISDTPYSEFSQFQLASELGQQGWELISETRTVAVEESSVEEIQTLWFKRQVE